MNFYRTQVRAIRAQAESSANNFETFRGPYLQATSYDVARQYAEIVLPFLLVTSVIDNEPVLCPVIQVPDAFRPKPADTIEQQDERSEELPECVEAVEDEGIVCEGDTVMLKSGGPLMTVRTASDTWCEVFHFVGPDLIEITIPPACLIIINR